MRLFDSRLASAHNEVFQIFDFHTVPVPPIRYGRVRDGREASSMTAFPTDFAHFFDVDRLAGL